MLEICVISGTLGACIIGFLVFYDFARIAESQEEIAKALTRIADYLEKQNEKKQQEKEEG